MKYENLRIKPTAIGFNVMRDYQSAELPSFPDRDVVKAGVLVESFREKEHAVLFMSALNVDPVTYILVGGVVANLYHNEDIHKVLKAVKTQNLEWDLIKFDVHKSHISNLLLAYDGWTGFATITKNEYRQFKKIQNENRD